jgi:hypothetical protein
MASLVVEVNRAAVRHPRHDQPHHRAERRIVVHRDSQSVVGQAQQRPLRHSRAVLRQIVRDHVDDDPTVHDDRDRGHRRRDQAAISPPEDPLTARDRSRDERLVGELQARTIGRLDNVSGGQAQELALAVPQHALGGGVGQHESARLDVDGHVRLWQQRDQRLAGEIHDVHDMLTSPPRAPRAPHVLPTGPLNDLGEQVLR